MDKNFPKELITVAHMPGIKKFFVSDIRSPNPTDCQNCGGIGSFTLFLATDGPFQGPAASPKISKFYEDKWWVGTNEVFICPSCFGEGKVAGRRTYVPMP